MAFPTETLSEEKLKTLCELRDEACDQISKIMMFIVHWHGLAEKFERHQPLSEEKLKSLRQLRDEACDQIYKIMTFVKHWQALAEYFQIIRIDILKQAQELALKENKLVVDSNFLDQREKDIEIKFKSVDEEFQLKQNELGSIKTQIQTELTSKKQKVQECNRELSLKKEELDSAKKELDSAKKELEKCDKEFHLKKEILCEYHYELQMKEKSLNSIEAQIQDSTVEINSKQKQLNLVEEAIEECYRESILKKEELDLVKKELEDCHKEFLLKKEILYECSHEIQMKEKSLNSIKAHFEDYTVEINSKQKQLNECYRELSSKKQEVEECKRELSLKKQEVEECCNEIVLKKEDLSKIQKSIEKCTTELEREGTKLDFCKRNFQECSMELGSSHEKLELVKKSLQEHSIKLEHKEKELQKVDILISKNKSELERNKSELEECCNEIVLKNENLSKVQKSLEIEGTKLNFCKRNFQECSKELGTSHEKLELVKQSLQEHSIKLEHKQKELQEVENLINENKSELEECCNEIVLKKEDLSEVQKSLEKYTAELERESTKLDFCKRNFQECSKELSASHEKLELVKMSFQEHSIKLEHKAKELQKVEISINKNKSEVELHEKKLQDLITSYSVTFDRIHEELEGIRKSIKDSEKELDLKRKVHEHARTLAEESKKESDLLQKELSRIHKLMEERSKELSSKELELDSIKQLIEDYNEELDDKEKQHDVVKKSVNQCSALLKVKEKELALIEKYLKKNSGKLHAEDEKLDSSKRCREIEEKKLRSLKKSIKHYEEINLRGSELNAIQISILDRQKELGVVEEVLKSVKATIEETTTELMSMRGERMSIQNSIMKCSKELELEQSRLDSVRNSLEECCNELSSKEVQQSVILIMCCEYLRELQEQKAYFDSLNRTVEERVKKLQKEEKQIEANVNNLNSMKQKFDFRQETLEGWQGEAQLAGKQISTMLASSENIEQCNSSFISLSPVLQCCVTGNGSKLQMLLNEQLRKNDLVHFEIFEFIKMSPDPAKLVLDAMHGFHPAGLNNGHMGFDLDVVGRSCITLLEQVVKIAPQIEPHVRKEAMRLALEWKQKMKPRHEYSLEALAFLELLAAYKLDYAFSVDELRELLDVVECKQKRDRYEALGKGIRHGNIEHAECSNGNPSCSSAANFRSSATGIVRSPELLLNELVFNQDLSIDEVRDGIQFSPDPARLVLDVMRGSYFQFWNNGNSNFDASLVRNIVLLLEQLMKISPRVSHQVKETALQQVLVWKDNISMDTQNSSEILTFLMFMAAYDLVSYFRREEIVILIENIVHHKQAPETCRALGFTNEIAGVTANLIQRKQFLAAARFSRAFELSVKFLPETILKSYLRNTQKDASESSYDNNSFEEQCNIIDKEAATLREFVECVVDCKLESIFPPGIYMRYIAERQGMKTHLAQLYSAPPSMAQQSLLGHMAQQQPTQLMQERTPYTVGTSNPSYQQFFGPGKRPRQDTTVVESYQGSTAHQCSYFHGSN